MSFACRDNPEGAGLGYDLRKALYAPHASAALIEDVVMLTQAVVCLFHCNQLPVRLASTHLGPGSEWLPDEKVNRKVLRAPSATKPDIVRVPEALDTLSARDVALTKGTS